jgi:drug/metabolite transporter (DMT)-like permease
MRARDVFSLRFLDTTPGPRLAFAVAALLVVVWGTTWAAIRLSLEGLPPFLSMSLRFGLASLLLSLLARRLKVPLIGPGARGPMLMLVQALGAFGISYAVIYWAEQWVPSGLASVLFATLPFFVALLGYFVLPGETLGWKSILGILLGFAGVALIFADDLSALGGAQVRLASAVILISPLAVCLSQMAVKIWGSEYHSLTLTALPMGCSAILMALLSWLVESERVVAPTPSAWLAVIYLAVVGSAFTFTLFFWLLTRGNLLRVSMIAYGTPVVAVFVGTIFLDEKLTWKLVAGAALVLSGVFAVVGKKK